MYYYRVIFDGLDGNRIARTVYAHTYDAALRRALHKAQSYPDLWITIQRRLEGKTWNQGRPFRTKEGIFLQK